LERTLAETGEAIEYLRTASQPQRAARGAAVRLRFDAGGDPREPAQRLAIEGSGLDGKEILCLIEWLDRASEARSLVSSARERFPRLAAHAERIAEFRPMVAELAGKILPDGTLADHASVALNRIRRDIDRQRNAIQGSLERFLRQHQADGILQEEFVTIRNDRFVVPLVAGRQRKVEGVIHAASGSGHTLFLEQ
jgi:DNA mismatch repair protein MutS2